MYGVLCQSGKLFLRRLICNANTNDRTRILRLSSTDVTSLYDEIEANKNRKRTKVQRLTRKTFEKYLQTKLNCPVDVATNIWFAHRELSDIHLTNVESNVDLLTGKGVAIKQILELPSLLSLSTGNLEHRLHILGSMKPHKIEDFVPLAIVDDMRLNQIRWTAEREKKLIPSRHRIYHFSELLEMTPYTISKYVSNRLYMLHMPFADVDQRIRTLLTYKTPEQIVANLWIIRYSETALELMGRARRAEPKKETFSMTEHYAKRLECDIAEVENLMKLYPFLATMDVMKLDRRLDFLLEEIGVEASTIISVPRILMKSVDMMKERFYELESLGYGCQGHQQMMIKVSLSNSRYAKFLAELKSQPRKDESNNYLVRKWTDFRKLFH